MDIYDRVSGSAVFVGSCILSISSLFVWRKSVLPNRSLELSVVEKLIFGYERYSIT
jgi:hypothetical protein